MSRDQSGGFSVSAAKALFEAAKKPEIRNAAIAAAKNPFVRQTAKAVARDENARGAVLNAMKDPNASNKFNAAMAVASAKTRSSDDTPPPPPPHRGVNAPKPSDQHSSIRAKLENLHIGGGASSSSSSYGSMNQKASTSSAPPPPPPHKKSTDEPHGLALYDYTPTQSDEISLRVGDKIILKRYVDDQWVYGENSKTYQTGIIPLAYLNVVIPLPSSAKSFPSVPGKVYATALYDYNSQTPGDLSFFANQSIVVHSKINNEWLEGECSGQRGIFPANFVDCPNISQLPSSAPINPTPISGNLETVVAAFDYNSGVATDLQFNAGEIITIVEHVDSDWLMGELHGRRGLVPKTFLGSPYGSPSKEKKGIAEISSAFSPKKALAVSDYHSDDPKHLYVTRGDHLLIVEDVDEYYYRGKLESFKTLPAGILPKNIVKLEE